MKKGLILLSIFVVLAASAFAGGGAEAPLGSEDNPIVWSFVPSGELQEVAAGADEIARLLFEETGLYITTNVATEYAGVIEAMAADPPSAHMSALATFAYIQASDLGVAEAALVAVRYRFGNLCRPDHHPGRFRHHQHRGPERKILRKARPTLHLGMDHSHADPAG
jgi:ABC-type phosphate/phosphonate transport system substrate-binding protein